jgi:ribosome-associated protein
VRAIVVSETVRVPESAITVRATRASGPGGQHVNKVATKIDLRVELAAIEGLSEAARRRSTVSWPIALTPTAAS